MTDLIKKIEILDRLLTLIKNHKWIILLFLTGAATNGYQYWDNKTSIDQVCENTISLPEQKQIKEIIIKKEYINSNNLNKRIEDLERYHR